VASAGSAWCQHFALLSQATGKNVPDGLKIIVTAADQLAQDAHQLRTQGRSAQAQALDAITVELRKDHDLIDARGYSTSISVSVKGGLFGETVDPSEVESVRAELEAVAGVQSITWDPNFFTVKLGVFMTFQQMERRFKSLSNVDTVMPDFGSDLGLDPTQAQQQDTMIAALRQINCQPPISEVDIPYLP
jgi:hypothetical protein